MTTATITMIYCVQPTTGTDFATNLALASLPEKLVPSELGAGSLVEALHALPGVVEAITSARSDQDNLYLTTHDRGEVAEAIWPGPGAGIDMRAGQATSPCVVLDFSGSANLSLWDQTFVSSDELLGSATLLESERGQGEIAKRAASSVEGSVYYVSYTVE